MDNYWALACGAGLHDSLNPCIFMACAVFIALKFWLPINILRLGMTFGIAYLINALNFNFGLGQIFIFNPIFIYAAKVIYFVLGIWAFILGGMFLRDWILLCQSKKKEVAPEKIVKTSAVVTLLIIVLAVLLSSLGSLWPVNNYVLLIGNGAILKSRCLFVISFLGIYFISSMWPVWMMWIVLSVKNLRPSFVRILCSAIFFTASSCMVLIFK